MSTFWLAATIVVAGAIVVWIIAVVFRGGAPTGDSSSRADTFATGAGFGAEDADTLRHKQGK